MPAAIHALSIVPGAEFVRVLGATLAVRGGAPGHRLVYTADGSEPGPGSSRYRRPLDAAAALRAGLIVEGRVVASLAAGEPKFRIPANAPPDEREPFHR
jgi:hypothetical protein